jgi:exosortase
MQQRVEIRQASTTGRLSPDLLFAVLCAISLGLWYPSLLQTMARALGDERYTHILLILPVSAMLIFQSMKSETRTRSIPSVPLPAAVLLFIALFLTGLARWGNVAATGDTRLALSMAGLILWWTGSFLLCFGAQALRTLLFPFAFLWWLVPLPAVFLARVIEWLQYGSAIASEILFSAVGTRVWREGILLFLPQMTLEVAPECSSIRSSLMLIVTTMILAQMLLHSPWRKAAVIAISFPLCIAKNGLRIFTLGMLATHVDPSYMNGSLHHHGGVIFFAAALAATFLLLWLLRRGERPGTSTERN